MSIDILDTCAQLNTSEMKLLQFIRDEVEANGSTITPADSKAMTPYIKVALKKGYKHLNEMGLLTRVSRGTYEVSKNLFYKPAYIDTSGYVPATKAILRGVIEQNVLEELFGTSAEQVDIEVVSSHSGDAAKYLKGLGL